MQTIDRRPKPSQRLNRQRLINYASQLFISTDSAEPLTKYRRRTEAIAILIGADTGLRSSDLLTLKWQDIKAYKDAPNTYYIEIGRQKKTGRPVANPLSHEVSSLIQEYRATVIAEANRNRLPLTDYIFYNYSNGRHRKAGNPLPLFTRAWLRKRIKLAAEAGNFGEVDVTKGFGGHSLRRSYATYIYEARDLRLASKALGHASMSATSEYLKLDAKEVDESLRELKNV
jgi:integrase